MVFMMVCLSYRLPTAALLHIGPVAKPRFLGLATVPICWVPPTHPKQMRSDIYLFLAFVLLHGHLLVNYVKSYIFSFNGIC